MTPRACIACPTTYNGPLACPTCGEPGEPMEPPMTPPRGNPGKPPGQSRNPNKGGVQFKAVLSAEEGARLEAAREAAGLSRADWLMSDPRLRSNNAETPREG